MNEFSQILKLWRKARRYSQLDLAMAADVSSRHVSFLETGRAHPSRDMIRRLGDALQMPLSARNQMLLGAGFAARYTARQWDEDEMATIRAAVAYTLDSHDPYPALAIDRLWTVMRLNASAARLFGLVNVGEGDSLLDLMTSSHLPEQIENWPEVAHQAAQRLRMESAAGGGIAELDEVAEKLSLVPLPAQMPRGPVVPTIYRAGALRLSLFATLAQFGTPEDLMLDDLRIELYFPADVPTEQALRAAAT